MNFLKRWFADNVVQIEVDYSKDLYIPQGASGVCKHTPVGRGYMSLLPNSLELRALTPGVTCDTYIKQHLGDALCDAAVLDALVAYVISRETKSRSRYEILEQLFGDFRGRVLFPGTTFLYENDVECVPYLNVRTLNPDLRYVCPIHMPLDYDFDVRVCHLAPLLPIVGP